MADNKKRILYLVMGGHGGQPFMDLWVGDTENTHVLIFNTCDSGGSSAVISKAFDNDPRLLPMGDPRSNMVIWLGLMGKTDLANQMKLRVDNKPDDIERVAAEKLTIEFNFLLSLLPELSTDLVYGLKDFLRIYIEKYDALGINDKFEHDNNGNKVSMVGKDGNGGIIMHSIGNLLLTGLQYVLGSTESMLATIKAIGLVPQNVELSFISDFRLEQKAVDEKGLKYNFQHEVNWANNKIPCDQFYLWNNLLGRELTPEDVPHSIREEIAKANLVIIPPGSPSNTFSFIKYVTPYLASSDLKIKRIVNATRSVEDDDFISELIYLRKTLGLEVEYLLPTKFIDESGEREIPFDVVMQYLNY